MCDSPKRLKFLPTKWETVLFWVGYCPLRVTIHSTNILTLLLIKVIVVTIWKDLVVESPPPQIRHHWPSPGLISWDLVSILIIYSNTRTFYKVVKCCSYKTNYYRTLNFYWNWENWFLDFIWYRHQGCYICCHKCVFLLNGNQNPFFTHFIWRL